MPLAWPRRKPAVPGPLLPPEQPERQPGWLGRLVSLRRASLRRLRPTREGWVFMATGMAVALAALNTGNNLLYLVLAAMLALVVTSGVLSESSLRGLEVRRRFDERVFAGRRTRGTWVVRSGRRWLPNLAIDVQELPGAEARLVEVGEASIPYLPGGGEERRRATWIFGCRGVHRLDRVRVSTTWPFGILRKWYEVRLPIDVLVYPEPSTDWAPVTHRTGGGAGDHAGQRRRGGTGDLRGIRDHRQGEDLRQVHWRTSARLRRRVSVERDAEDEGRFVVDVSSPAEGSRLERATVFEDRIRQAAGAVLAAGESGSEVVLRLPKGATSPASTVDGRDRLLRRLALLELDA